MADSVFPPEQLSRARARALADCVQSADYRDTVGAALAELRRAYLADLLLSPGERMGGKSDEFLRGAVDGLRRLEVWVREVLLHHEAPPEPIETTETHEASLPWERVEIGDGNGR